MRTNTRAPVAVMRATWRHLADPGMWPVYRLGFALRSRAYVATADHTAERDNWVAALKPLAEGLGVPVGWELFNGKHHTRRS